MIFFEFCVDITV